MSGESKSSGTLNPSDGKDRDESKLITILSNVKGISSKSMISIQLPSYRFLSHVVQDLMKRCKVEKQLEESPITIFDEIHDIESKQEYKASLVLRECADFLGGIKWQDEDKKNLALLVFYGHIDTGGTKSKGDVPTNHCKIFHTFPATVGKFVAEPRIEIGARFNTKLLLSIPEFVEYFGNSYFNNL